MLVSCFDPSINFWTAHPDLLVGAFKELYDKDKSKDKSESSLIMWFVAFCYDMDSRFYKLPIEGEFGRHILIGGDICGNKELYAKNKKKIDPLISFYCYLDDNSAAKRQMRQLDKDMDDRTSFQAGLKYSLDSWEIKDKMAISTDKLIEVQRKIKEALAKDEGKGVKTKAGRTASLSDTGEI